jgi:hypothetical protein
MKPLGLPAGSIVRLLREVPTPVVPTAPIVVVGPLAPQLARALAAGGDATLVQEGAGVRKAAVLVCVLGGDPTPDQSMLLRAAARSGTPVVGVQTGKPTNVSYIPAGAIVDCPPGSGFPIDRIAVAIAASAGPEAAGLASRLPTLRRAAVRSAVGRAAIRAAAIAGLPWVRGSHLPLLLPLQAQLVREVSSATGGGVPDGPLVAGTRLRPELGVALATGLVGRRLARGLAFRSAPARAMIAGGATLALGVLAAARGSSNRVER